MRKKILFLVLTLAAVAVIIFTGSADRLAGIEATGQRASSVGVTDQVQSPESRPLGIDFYRQLSPGARLQLQLDNQGALALVDIAINKASSVDGATTVRGTVDPRGSFLMTIGDQFIHIFLSYAGGIYEYSGRDFQGTVARTTEMGFENDIARPPNRLRPGDTEPVRRSAEAIPQDPRGEEVE